MSPADADARFDRQRLLPGLGDGWLARLRDARVHVVGAGPVAAPALLYLARAGVGTLYVDDGADVAPWEAGWLYGPGHRGRPRMLVALEVLRAASATVEVRPAATDTSATAMLVCAEAEAVVRAGADRARRAGLPHVLALGDAGGGEVIGIPPGTPCYDCACHGRAARPGVRVPPSGGVAAALGSLAALELLLLLTALVPAREAGRRLVLAEGLPRAEPTVRRPGCGCRRA